MAFDIEGAKKAGYQESEIADYLASKNGFDVNFARKSGYNDSEIIDFLSKSEISGPAAPGTDVTGMITSEQAPGAVDIALGEIPGIAGGLAGGIAKTIPGRTGLSSLLSAGGEGYHQIYQHITGDPNAPQTSTEAGKRMLETAGFQGIGQLVGEGLTRGAGKLIPRVKPEYLTGGLEEPMQNLKPYMEPYLETKGILRPRESAVFTIGQQADPLSSAVVAENIIEKSFFGGGPIKRLKWAQEKGIQDMAANVSKRIWNGTGSLPPSERGRAFVEMYQSGYNQFSTEAGKLASELDDIASNAQVPIMVRRSSNILDASGNKIVTNTPEMTNKWVDLSPLKKFAQEKAAEYESRAQVGASQMGDSLLNKIMNLPDRMSFAEAQDLRTAIRLEKEGFERRDIARGLARKFESLTDSSMENAARQVSPETLTKWREFNDFYKTGMEKYKNDFIKNIIKIAQEKGQPELVGKAVFQNGEIGQINQVKAALGYDFQKGTWSNNKAQEAFNSMKAGWLEGILSDATTPEGIVQGSKVFEKLKSMSGKSTDWTNSETIRAIFTPKEIKMIQMFEMAARTTQRQSVGGGGSMLIQLMQAKPLADVATMGVSLGVAGTGIYKDNPEAIAAGISVLALPRVFGKMFVNPKYQELFIKGLNARNPVAGPAIAKLAAGAVETYNEINRQTEKSSQIGRMTSSFNSSGMGQGYGRLIAPNEILR